MLQYKFCSIWHQSVPLYSYNPIRKACSVQKASLSNVLETETFHL
jgi:hypothetical protein